MKIRSPRFSTLTQGARSSRQASATNTRYYLRRAKKKNKTKKLVPDFGLGVCSLVGELLVFDRDLGCFEK